MSKHEPIRGNPCIFCMNLYDDSDHSVGYEGYGCAAETEYPEVLMNDGIKPCPAFKPVLVSEYLECQLYQESEYRALHEEEYGCDEE